MASKEAHGNATNCIEDIGINEKPLLIVIWWEKETVNYEDA